MGGCELLGRAVLDEFSVEQLVNGALLARASRKGVPRRDQVAMIVIDLVHLNAPRHGSTA
jgi:hypothetical protein